MRDLTSLQENEEIFVKSKHWKYFKKQLGFTPINNSNVYVGKNHIGFYWDVTPNPCSTILPASDFIPPKKPKLTETRIREELVEKNEVNVDTELEIGKWYHDPEKHYLVCVQSLSGKDEVYFTAYGFCNGIWQSSNDESMDHFNKDAEWIQANDSEVQTALINEAKRRGYKEGVKVKYLDGTSGILSGSYFKFHSGVLYASTHPYCEVIFKDGKWAEIITDPELRYLPEQTIDWGKAGQLVISIEGQAVLMITGRGALSGSFSGVCVVGDSITSRGEYYDSWDIIDFKPYKGEPIKL